MRHRIILPLSLLLHNGLDAQVTVPDPAFAAILETIIPDAITGNVLDTLHADVTGLTTMFVGYEGISDLDGVQYFDSLKYLNCDHNDLVGLPTLPPGLIMLQCHNNQLAALPALPATLTHLFCHGNAFTALPALPPALVSLDCHACPLTGLPALPPSLTGLDCFNAQLEGISK